jgi:hypothetical protein
MNGVWKRKTGGGKRNVCDGVVITMPHKTSMYD